MPPYKMRISHAIYIGLASPDKILERSHGEVTKPETINYRSFKPEKDGLFCEKIFGPVRDWECHCGKYKRIRYKGIVCDRCGVEVTMKSVRRERMGHITLAVPVVHIWYWKSLPSKIGYILGMSIKELEKVIYYESYVVVRPGKSGLSAKELITEDDYLELNERMREQETDLPEDQRFFAEIGGTAVHALLRHVNIDTLSHELRYQARNETSIQRKADALKRLKVVEAFRRSNRDRENRPDWMVMSVIPVVPPELRPLVPLEGGRFATSDLNDLYRRVIIRNNRLKKLLEIKAPEVILRNEKRMLQEAVDSLVRQRPQIFGRAQRRQPRPQEPFRHAPRQAGTLPPELARQAYRLFRPFGHRRRSRAPSARVRSAQGDGARALQALCHPQAGRTRPGQDRQERQKTMSSAAAPRCGISSRRSSTIIP